jgi:endonuclease-3 related protein
MLDHYGPLRWWPGETPFEVMVGAILTQNTAWRRVVPAISNLRNRGLLEPATLHALPEPELAEAIRPAGTFRVKARYLKTLAEWLVAAHGGDAAEALRGETMTKRRELLSLRGIGRETADSILLYAGGHAIFVVDAYTRRILSRHGFVAGDEDYDVIRAWLTERVPATAPLLNELHAQIVNVGKDFCRPRNPRCAACPLGFLLGPDGGE